MKEISRPLLVALFLFAFVSINCSLANSAREKLESGEVLSSLGLQEEPTPTSPRPTPRPTFTPTPNYTATPTVTPTPTITPIPTDTPTPIPTNTPVPTNTPEPTATAEPTNTRVPPTPAPPTEVPTPEPTPTPSYPFNIKEQADRAFQRTNNSILSNIILITDGNGTPLGGIRLVGTHSTGIPYESAPSSWQFDAVNGLEGYVKQGNLKFEPPGGHQDGTWTVYLADSGGTRVSADVALSYSSDPNQWAWDFIWWSK